MLNKLSKSDSVVIDSVPGLILCLNGPLISVTMQKCTNNIAAQQIKHVK